MLVNKAETAVRVIDPDLVYACVTVAVQPSVARMVERLTIVLYTILCCRKTIGRWLDSGHSEISGECDDLLSRNFATLLCGIAHTCAESRKAMRMNI